MLRFRLFGFPITIHWFFWISAVLLCGYTYVQNQRPIHFQLIGIWVLVVFVSVLVHELGHAIAFKKYGGRPSILLQAFGGLASSSGYYSRRQHIIISAAGPAAGLLLGGIAWIITQFFPPSIESIRLAHLVIWFLWVNIVWSLINLLPVPPLDGGQIFAAAYRGRNHRYVVHTVGMVTAIIAAVGLFLSLRSFFAPFLFGFLAYQNYMQARGLSTPRLF